MPAFTNTAVSYDDMLATVQARLGSPYNALAKQGIAPSDHATLAQRTGIPEILLRLQDDIWQGLSWDDRREWGVQFIKACRPGVDLEPVWPRFAIRMLREIVLPMAGSAAPVVERVARGYETGWKNDTAEEAEAKARGPGGLRGMKQRLSATRGAESASAAAASAARTADTVNRTAAASWAADAVAWTVGLVRVMETEAEAKQQRVTTAYCQMRDILLYELRSASTERG